MLRVAFSLPPGATGSSPASAYPKRATGSLPVHAPVLRCPPYPLRPPQQEAPKVDAASCRYYLTPFVVAGPLVVAGLPTASRHRPPGLQSPQSPPPASDAAMPYAKMLLRKRLSLRDPSYAQSGRPTRRRSRIPDAIAARAWGRSHARHTRKDGIE